MPGFLRYQSTSNYSRQPQLDPILGPERYDDIHLAITEGNFQPIQDQDWEVVASRREIEQLYVEQGDNRPLFEKDRDKIVSSPFFNRLQHVTQVEHHSSSDEKRKFATQHYHSRLTHTFEVARFAVRIALNMTERQPDLIRYYSGIETHVVEATAFAHDLGHPPFGHVCEQALAAFMEPHGGFEGNAQTFRILTTLESRQDTGYLQLTRRTWASCLKYPWTFTETQEYTRSTGKRLTKYSVYDVPSDLDTDSDPLSFVSIDKDVFDWLYLTGRYAKLHTSEDLSTEDESAINTDVSANNSPAITDRIRTPESEIMDYADDVAYSTSDFCEAFPNNESLRRLLVWSEFEGFIKRNRIAFEGILRSHVTGFSSLDIDEPGQLKVTSEFEGHHYAHPNETLPGKQLDLEPFLTEGVVDWAILYFLHRHIRAYEIPHNEARMDSKGSQKGKAEFSTRDKLDAGRIAMRIALDNTLKNILMNPVLTLPKVFEGQVIPLTAAAFGVSGARFNVDVVTEPTLELTTPTHYLTLGSTHIHSVTRRGKFVGLLLSVLKLAVRIHIHDSGEQRDGHILGALQVVLLLQTFRQLLVSNSGNRKHVLEIAKDRFLNEQVDAIDKLSASLREDAKQHGRAYDFESDQRFTCITRFCCDLVASLMELDVRRHFTTYCTKAAKGEELSLQATDFLRSVLQLPGIAEHLRGGPAEIDEADFEVYSVALVEGSFNRAGR